MYHQIWLGGVDQEFYSQVFSTPKPGQTTSYPYGSLQPPSSFKMWVKSCSGLMFSAVGGVHLVLKRTEPARGHPSWKSVDLRAHNLENDGLLGSRIRCDEISTALDTGLTRCSASVRLSPMVERNRKRNRKLFTFCNSVSPNKQWNENENLSCSVFVFGFHEPSNFIPYPYT